MVVGSPLEFDQTGIDHATAGADFINHCASNPASTTEDLVATRGLLQSATRNGIKRFAYISFVGVDRPSHPYYEVAFVCRVVGVPVRIETIESASVVAAGGIADGRGIAAAFALGAAGTQIWTAYLLYPEAATPSLYRDALRQARADTTFLTNVFTGRPARILVNRLALEVGPISDSLPDFPLPMGELAPLRAMAEQKGNCDFTPFWSGQASPLAREMPARR